MPNTSEVIPSVELSAPGEVEAGRGAARSPAGTRGAAASAPDAERHVDEEADAPGEQPVEEAADDEPEAGADAGDGAVGPDGAGALGPAGKLLGSSASVDGARMAAPTPWTARARISHAGGPGHTDRQRGRGEQRHPTMKMRRRPNRSPARAPSSSSPPKASR